MTWQCSPEFESLLALAADAELDEAQEMRLAEILRDDPAARPLYFDYFELHAELHWDYAAASMAPQDMARSDTAPHGVALSESAVPRWRNRGRLWATALAVAAAVLAIIGVWLRPFTRSTPIAIAELVSVDGAVSWTDGRGQQRTGLVAGTRLPAGMITLEGWGATAQLQFADGTRLMLSSDSQIEFDADPQKRLVVRQGLLSADVAPQPAGRPLLVRTATAEMEVVGTEFSLAAESDATRLNVQSGRVRMRRLVDGRTIDVDAQQAAVASFDRQAELAAARPGLAAASWTHDFTQPWKSRWRGEWLPATPEEPSRVRAAPCIAGRSVDGTPIIHFGFTIRGDSAQQLVTLSPESVFTMRFRSAEPAALRIMLGVVQPNGAFGGNFQVVVLPQEFSSTDDGWQTVTVPLTRFAAMILRHPQLPPDGQLSLLFVNTLDQDAALEAAGVSIARSTP